MVRECACGKHWNSEQLNIEYIWPAERNHPALIGWRCSCGSHSHIPWPDASATERLRAASIEEERRRRVCIA